MNKKLKAEIKKEVASEFSSRMISLFVAAVLTKIMIPAWKWYWFATEDAVELMTVVGGVIIFLAMLAVTILTIFLWIIPFTKDGMDMK